MEALLSPDKLALFLLFVVPGLISVSIYRLLLPSPRIDWGSALLQGIFYSCLNFCLFLPLIMWASSHQLNTKHPVWYGALSVLVLLVGPVIWPFLLSLALRSKWLTRWLQHPFPTAWDYFFDKRETAFVIVHLSNGKIIGGYFGKDSYASAFPEHGDIYLERVYNLNQDGVFGDCIADSRGVLIERSQYSYIELFYVPRPKGGASD